METCRSQSGHRAFSLTELLVVIVILAILAALFLSRLANVKGKDTRTNCSNNLKQVGLAFRMWGDEHDVYPMRYRTSNFDGPSFALQQKIYIYYQTMSNELSTPKILICPSDNRNPALNFAVLDNTNVSYFVGMDAEETVPQMLLLGDRNLALNNVPVQTGVVSVKSTDKLAWTQQEIHRGQGNVGMADGSVYWCTSSGLQQDLRHTGTNMNRLAVP
jgi:prepilin-type N-terminal cleavage/methylation domain-containing protein/prepilin-type processing-associated H-X9-DG protein